MLHFFISCKDCSLVGLIATPHSGGRACSVTDLLRFMKFNIQGDQLEIHCCHHCEPLPASAQQLSPGHFLLWRASGTSLLLGVSEQRMQLGKQDVFAKPVPGYPSDKSTLVCKTSRGWFHVWDQVAQTGSQPQCAFWSGVFKYTLHRARPWTLSEPRVVLLKP